MSNSVVDGVCAVLKENAVLVDAEAMLEIVLPWFQIGSAAVSIGIAEAALGNAVQHVTSSRLEHMGQSLAAAVPEIGADCPHAAGG
jgi:hypothetical protein